MTEVYAAPAFPESPAFLLLDESALISEEKRFSSIEENVVRASDAMVLDSCAPSSAYKFSLESPGVVALSDSDDDEDDDNSFDPQGNGSQNGPVVDDNNISTPHDTTTAHSEPTATALPISLALTPQVDMSCSTWTRPEYLYTKFYKPSPKSATGIVLTSRSGSAVISRIEPASLISRTNLRPGDRIMSVNGVSCLDLSPEKVASLIKDAHCEVSITVRNKHGNPVLVSTCVQKRFPKQKCGIAFQNKRGSLMISRVEVDGLFGNTLLMPGHRCCYINDHVCLSSYQVNSRQAAELVSQTPEFLTFVSQPDHAMAMVLACESTNVWFRHMAVGFGLAAGAISAMR